MGRDERGRTRLPRRALGPDVAWSDGRLIRACLNGNERAWSALIEKYRRLIYSIPVKYGAGPDDAADIFQSVCLELVNELPRLRRKAAFRSWLITVTAHQAYQLISVAGNVAVTQLVDKPNLGVHVKVPKSLFRGSRGAAAP